MSRTLLATVLAVVVAGCTTAAGAPADARDADLVMVARDMRFEPAEVVLPAGRPITIGFENEDSMPHNVAIYTDASRSESIFVGELIGSGVTLYHLPAIASGTYFLVCDLHPEMTGSLLAE